MPIKSVKMKISKNKKMRFFLMSQGSLDPKIRFIGQKVCSVARVHTDRQTHRQTDTKVNTEDTLSGFQEFFLQPIIKDRSNNKKRKRNNIGPVKSVKPEYFSPRQNNKVNLTTPRIPVVTNHEPAR